MQSPTKAHCHRIFLLVIANKKLLDEWSRWSDDEREDATASTFKQDSGIHSTSTGILYATKPDRGIPKASIYNFICYYFKRVSSKCQWKIHNNIIFPFAFFICCKILNQFFFKSQIMSFFQKMMRLCFAYKMKDAVCKGKKIHVL